MENDILSREQKELIDILTNRVDKAIRRQSCSTYEDWQKLISEAVIEYRIVGPSILCIRRLPWICGDCGRESVQNLRKYDGDSLIGTCDNCGAEWIS